MVLPTRLDMRGVPGIGDILVTSPRRAGDKYLFPSATGTKRTARVCKLDLSSNPESLARFGATFFRGASPGPGGGDQVPGLGAELGDGVRSGSLAGISTRPIWGFPEWAEPEERW